MQAIQLTVTIAAPPASIWRALTSAVQLPNWLCNTAHSAPAVDGALFLGWQSGYYAAGHYTLVDAERALSYVWRGRGEPGETHVAFTLEPIGDGTRLTLVHDQFGSGDRWALARAECARGWETGLEALKSLLEEGMDLRLARRPLLGVAGATPVAQPVAGFQIGTPFEGLGAHAAGLQAGDILTAIDDVALDSPGAYRAAMQRHRAGDRIAVRFVRDGQPRTAELTLSSLPRPVLPATPAEVGTQQGAVNAALLGELQALLAEVTPAEACFQPAPGEWHIMHVLAHLIYSEQTVQHALLMARSDQPEGGFLNDNDHLAAIVDAHGATLAALLAELRRQWTISEQMTLALPADFAHADRPTFTQHATRVLYEWPAHTRSHLAQIQAALAAARAASV